MGGVNNDGGSALVPSGLLINEDPSCGVPLTISDGMDTLNSAPNNWQSNGILDFFSGEDNTMFGSLVSQSSFQSEGFALSCSGVRGTDSDSNQVIIAQLTTLGEISFNLNIAVEQFENGAPRLVNYVSSDTLLAENERFNAYLSYPYTCGCNNPNYLEYSTAFACLQEGSCITPVVSGCTDSLACNYNPQANLNTPALCCYPGSCAGRNIEEVCPSLMGNDFDVNVYPNPTSGDMTMNIISGTTNSNWSFEVYNTYGSVKLSGLFSTTDLNVVMPLDLSNLDPGMYQLKVSNGELSKHKLFIKL